MSDFTDKCRELGKTRWDAAAKIQSMEDHQKLWPKAPEFPIEFGKCWTHTFEYYVEDFLAEVVSTGQVISAVVVLKSQTANGYIMCVWWIVWVC